MLYPTLNQPYVFITIFLTGLVSGLLFDLSNFLLIFVNKNKVIKQFLYFFASALSFLGLFYMNLIVNLGQFRLFIIITFALSLFIERITLGSIINKTIMTLSCIKIKPPRFWKLKIKKTNKVHKDTSDLRNWIWICSFTRNIICCLFLIYY